MGLQALKNESWLHVDEDHASQTALKKELLAHQRHDVLATLPGSEPAQQVVLDLVEQELADRYPDLETEPIHANKNPIARAASLIQEDLVLMQRVAGDFKLTAACICFPSGWNLTEKVGHSVSHIHLPVPDLNNRIGPSIDRFFDNLNPSKKVQRFNWGIFDDDALFQPEWKRQERPPSTPITTETIGDNFFFRVERQTLQRLPGSEDILFTIRIFNTALSELTEDPERASILHHSLKTMPDPMRRYKAVAQYEGLLLDYLNVKSR